MKSIKKILVGVIAVLIVGGGLYLLREHYQAQNPPAPKAAGGRPGAPGGAGGFGAGPTPVVALPASLGSLDVVMNGLGTATPLRTVTVRSRVDGELVKVKFQEGQIVKQGELLAEIDPRAFQVALDQVQGQLARDQALLENAKLDLERYQGLFKQDSIAKQQVDTQASLVRQYEGAVKMDKGQVDNAKLQLGYTRISAPVGGRVGLRLVDQGNIVHAGDANGIVVITQLAPIAVVFTVPQDSVPVVMRRMQSEQIPVEAWDREGRLKLADGFLASADNQVDPATGTVKLKAQFDNADGVLFPNQFVNVRMKVDTVRDAIVVPTAAVQRGTQGLFVYVVRDDKTVTPRPVKLGAADVQRIVVADGLREGELVVVDGMDRLRPGATVEVTAARPEIKPPPEAARKGKGKGKGGKKAE